MNRSHLAKLFGAFGIILLVISLNTWLASQGGKAILSIPLISDERPAMCFFGLIMGSVLLFLTSAVGFLHARRTTGPWPGKIPAVWLEDLDPHAYETKLFRLMIVVIFVAVPIACLAHLLDVVWNSKLCVLGSAARPVMVSGAWFNGIPGADNQIRLVENLLPKGTCGNGIQVFPGWEFSLVWLAAAASLVMSLLFLLQLLNFKSSRGQVQASGDAEQGNR